MEKNLRLFDKSRSKLKLNNIGVHSNFAISEFYISTEKGCWKQVEDDGEQILSSLLGCFL